MNAEWVSGARAAWKCTVLVQARSHEAIMVAVDSDTARLPVRVSLGRFCAAADSDGAVDDVGTRYTKLCSALSGRCSDACGTSAGVTTGCDARCEMMWDASCRREQVRRSG